MATMILGGVCLTDPRGSSFEQDVQTPVNTGLFSSPEDLEACVC